MDAISLLNRFQPSRFATMTYDELIAAGLSDRIEDLSLRELIALVTCLALEFREHLDSEYKVSDETQKSIDRAKVVLAQRGLDSGEEYAGG